MLRAKDADMSAKDGGPAFPVISKDIGYHAEIKQLATGMSLRDYFAAQALGALSVLETDKQKLAHECYEFADAMLQERDKT